MAAWMARVVLLAATYLVTIAFWFWPSQANILSKGHRHLRLADDEEGSCGPQAWEFESELEWRQPAAARKEEEEVVVDSLYSPPVVSTRLQSQQRSPPSTTLSQVAGR